MRRLFSAIIASALLLTTFGTNLCFAKSTDSAVLAAQTNSTQNEVLQVTETGSKIPNTYAKMLKGEDIHLGYFGGSVTNGYGPANDYNEATQGGVNCWRGLSKSWLQGTYGTKYGMTFHEESRITTVTHAGAGGTGVDLNLYRADLYLDLKTEDPVDLLFIEFAVNDGYEGNSYEKSAFYMESLILKVRKLCPTTDIVVILTTNHTHLSNSSKNPHMNAQAHIDVANHYGVPYFWFGGYIYEFLASQNNGVLPSSGSELWQTYFSDGVHPSVRGYAKYFEFLRDNFLIPNLDSTKGFSTEVVNYTVPKTPYNQTQEFLTRNATYHPNSPSVYYKQKLRTDAYLMFPSQITNMGESGYGYLTYKPGGWGAFTTSDPGMSFTLKFKSRGAGIFYKGHPTQGLLEYRVDGGKWQQKDMYSAASDQYEYFMLYENLEEKEHTVDIILRKTERGSDFQLKSIFIDGDSTGYGVTVLKGAPNNKPLPEIAVTPIVLTPTYLRTQINDGATANAYHHAVTDTDVVRYTPNANSANAIMFDHYSDLFKSVSVPEYKYAVVKYYYELEPGSNISKAAGNRPGMDFIQLTGNLGNRATLQSADKIVLGGTCANTAIVDLTAITARTGHTGNLPHMQFHPFGLWVSGKSLAATELMNVESITFYPEYPFEDEYKIDVAVNKTVNSSATKIDLSGKRILPSAHRYATVKYTASEDTNITLSFDGLYDISNPNTAKSFSVTEKAPATGGEVTVSLREIAESGQNLYYDSLSLSANKNINIQSITFSVNYPYPYAEFTVSFDANGGNGMLPVAIKNKVDEPVSLPTASLQRGTQVFVGWAESPNATQTLQSFRIPCKNVTLYAVYKELNTVYVTNDAEGKFTYNGTQVTANYKALSEALAALGANGGRIVFSGVQDGNSFFTSQNASAPLIILEGANSNAAIRITNATVTLKCNTTFKNVNIMRGVYYKSYENRIAITDVYINAAGKKLVLDKGTFFRNEKSSGDINNPSTGQFDTSVNVAIPGYLSGGQLIMNSGAISGNFGGAGYNRDSSGNIYMEFNGGTLPAEICAGALRYADGSNKHTGNATVIINGGTLSSAHSILINKSSTRTTNITGATSVIINNGLSENRTFTIDSKFKYILKSSVGGKVTLAAEGSDTTAPTFLISATDSKKTVYINGTAVDSVNGQYLFTPNAKGTFTITYGDAPPPTLSEILDINNDNLFDNKDVTSIFDSIISKINSGNTDVAEDVREDINDYRKLNFNDIWNLMKILREYYRTSGQ